MPPKPVKFAVVADAHVGGMQQMKPPTRFPERARSLLRYVVTQLNSEHKPEFVVQLGDVIESEAVDEDDDNLSTAVDILGGLQMPLYHAVGNEEQTHLPLKSVCAAFKIPKEFYSFRYPPFLCVVLCAQRAKDQWLIGKEQLKWLEQELKGEDKHVLVFTHFPLVDPEVDEGGPEPKPDNEVAQPLIELSNRADVRHVLAQSGKVRGVFSAHWHRNSLIELGGIHYISVQSLVQNVSGNRPSESFAIAKFFEDSATIEVVGMDPMEFRI